MEYYYSLFATMPIPNPTSRASTITRPLTPGIFAPVPTFFLPGSEDLDIPTFQKHIIRIATANIGILICGSMGEAHHLTPPERVELIRAARTALDGANFATTPIIVGTAVGSTRETITLTKEAAEAGADYAIVIPSGYFAGAFDRKAIKGFFRDVAGASPIPVMLYNYPGAAGGIDMDSDLIEEMAMESPNLCGVKLTCGNVGKLTRIAATVGQPSFASKYPRKNKDAPFTILGGFTDFLLPSTFAGAHGAITGLANLYPHTIRELWTASISSLPTTTTAASSPPITPATLAQSLARAMHLQDVVAHAERTVSALGIAGAKWLMEGKFGYGGVCRLPIRPLDDSVGEALKVHPHVVAIEEMERSLESAHAGGNGVPVQAVA